MLEVRDTSSSSSSLSASSAPCGAGAARACQRAPMEGELVELIDATVAALAPEQRSRWCLESAASQITPPQNIIKHIQIFAEKPVTAF